MRYSKPIEYVHPDSCLTFVKQTVYKKAIYKCKCGKEREYYMNNVRRGKNKSCGCIKGIGNSTHRLTYHPLYCVWENVITRCYNTNCISYKNYGAKGVYVCDAWLEDPAAFINWGIENGYKKGLHLDKDIKCNEMNISPKCYSPETCCFVTPQENYNNRRTNRMITYNGATKSMAAWADAMGICHSTMMIRLSSWTLERALTTPKCYTK